MKNECNIIRDILPLYVENIISDETTEFVKNHIDKCVECQREYEQLKEPKVIHESVDVAPLLKLKRKIWFKRIQTITFAVILAIALVVSAFTVLSTPVYFLYSDDLLSVTENADKSITITFAEEVTDYSCDVHFYSDLENTSTEQAQCYYSIEAWTSLWDEWFSNRGVQSTIIKSEENLPYTVYYVSNDGSEDVCIYGNSLTEHGISLPRLALSYYSIIATVSLVVLLVARYILRRKQNIKVWIERTILYPISYIIGHHIVLGFNSKSYSIQRDFMLIIFISIIIYSGLLLARSIYGLRKEIKSTKTI